jgi:hypothetical protein
MKMPRAEVMSIIRGTLPWWKILRTIIAGHGTLADEDMGISQHDIACQDPRNTETKEKHKKKARLGQVVA